MNNSTKGPSRTKGPFQRFGKRRMAKNQSDKLKARKNKIYVCKIGGSAFDLIKSEKEKSYLGGVFDAIAQAHVDGFKIVLTCGAGPWGDASKEFGESFSELGFEEKPDREDISRSCNLAAKAIESLLNQHYIEKKQTPHLCRIRNVDFLGNLIAKPETLDNFIPVFIYSPRTAQADYISQIPTLKPHSTRQIPSSESDAHSIVIADWLGKRYSSGTELIFIKDAKGVYKFDPNRTDKRQEENERIKEISIDNFLDKDIIDRTGTDGRGDHLLETFAGNLFKEMPNIHIIRIISAREPGRFINTLYGENRGSIIYNSNYKNGNGDKK